MDKAAVVAGIAGELSETERAIDTALTHATGMVQTMIAGRTTLGISPIAGADSQAKVMAAIAALATAREAVVACHEEMAKDHRRMGWGTYAVGTLDKPSESESRPPVARLRAV
ncbi:hypothetical protein [Brevundimonas sp.]